MSDNSITRRLASEAIGTAFLLATVVGSGIMAERLAGGNVAIALLANTVATGAGLVALILTFGPVSGAHFNPAVTLADAAMGGLAWRDVLPYIAAQVLGAFAGVATAHVMFSEVIAIAEITPIVKTRIRVVFISVFLVHAVVGCNCRTMTNQLSLRPTQMQ